MLLGIIASLSKEDVIMSFVYRLELMLHKFKEESQRQNKVINQVTQILDMEGFGRSHMWLPGKQFIAQQIKN